MGALLLPVGGLKRGVMMLIIVIYCAANHCLQFKMNCCCLCRRMPASARGRRRSSSKSSLEDKRNHERRRQWQKKSEFLCQSKFRNNLPNPPLGPYFVSIPSGVESYVPYGASNLERSYKWKLHSEKNLGVEIDIIDPRNYLLPDTPPPMDPKDTALIDWHETKGGSGGGGKDGRRRMGSLEGHGVTWLKKTTYLTNCPEEAVHKFKTEQKAQMERQERLEKDLEQHRNTDPLSAVKQSFAMVCRNVY